MAMLAVCLPASRPGKLAEGSKSYVRVWTYCKFCRACHMCHGEDTLLGWQGWYQLMTGVPYFRGDGHYAHGTFVQLETLIEQGSPM